MSIARGCRVVAAAAVLVAALGTGAVAQEAPEPTEDDIRQVRAAVATVYQWEEQYPATVSGLIEESRSFPGVWSGSQNRDTEDERALRVEGDLMDERDAVLADAGERITEAVDPYEIVDHLERALDGGLVPRDDEIRDEVHAAYRDAIWDAMLAASLRANQALHD